MKSKSKPVSKNTGKPSAPKTSFWEKYETFTRNRWLIVAMLAVVSFVFFVNYSSIYDKKIDLNGDNIYYYSLGQALSQGEGYTNIIGYNKTPHSHFPPGYPFFISIINKISPDNIQAVKKANGFLLYLSVIMLFFLILITTRNSILAFCSSILMSMHKELLRFATIMMSETLFIFLSLGAMLLALLMVKEIIGSKRRWTLWVAMAGYALIIAYIYLVRTMGLSLILALVGWLGILTIYHLVRWRKSAKSQEETVAATSKQLMLKCGILCLITIVSVGIAKLSWDGRNSRLGIKNDDYQSMFMRKTNNETMQGVADWTARIKSNTSNFITRWIPEATYMKAPIYDDRAITGKEWMMGLLLMGVMIAGCLYLGIGRLLMLFYVGLTVGILILYPEQFGGLRYLTPIMPFFIFLTLNGLCAIVAGIFKLAKINHSPLMAQGFLTLLVALIVLAPKYTEAQEQYRKEARTKSWFSIPNINVQGFLEASKFCGDSLSKDARIICRKPEIFYMFSNFHPAGGFPQYADPDTIYNMLCRDSIDYMIVDNWFRHAYVTLYPCVQKYPEKFRIVKQIGRVDVQNHINPTLIFQFNDDWGYKGDMKDGKREGKGTLTMPDGRIYKGDFANDQPNGNGTLYDASGQVLLSGQWRNGNFVN